MSFILESLPTQWDNSSYDVLSITLLPRRDFREMETINKAEHSTIGGRYVDFKYSEFYRFNVPLQYVQSSDALLMNEWWQNRYDITFSYSLAFDVSTHTVRITNGVQPFIDLERPYKDEYSGTLTLDAL